MNKKIHEYQGIKSSILFAILLLLQASSISGQEVVRNCVLDLSDRGIAIQPTMYGVFFEDINFAGDGGLYAEMVKNRSFEFDDPLMGWLQPNTKVLSNNSNSGFATVINTHQATNTHFVRLSINNDSTYSIINEGFRGMGIQAKAKYNLAVNIANESGNISSLICQLVSKSGEVIGESRIALNSKEWKRYTTQITASKTELKASLKISFTGTGVLSMDMLSLFPEDTWKNRPGGLRKDLVQKLYDMNPGFLRFPGGCIVEGRVLSERYQWKKSMGLVENRETKINRWNTEFDHRPTPDYYQSYGLGFYEYFQLAEDLMAEPLPILSCGIACQFNSGELVPMNLLDPYVQDALDLIEFANGDTNSVWGKVRNEMGHPKPFNLKYIGVGNEQWGPDYIERYKVFEKAIHEKYPEMIIISGSGPVSKGDFFEYGWQELTKLNAQIIDEHYYLKADWFLENADRYDNYDRNGPKVFAGEYAAQSEFTCSPDNKNNWGCALAEAAFMTGLERNADVVYLTAYAPLMAHADAWQWTPDLIWFNNLESYATPNYYVQKLYANNAGTQLAKVTEKKKALSGQGDLYATAVVDENTKQAIVKLVNTADKTQLIKFSVKGAVLASQAKIVMLSAESLDAENNFENEQVSPVEQTLTINNKKIELSVPAHSFLVLKASIK